MLDRALRELVALFGNRVLPFDADAARHYADLAAAARIRGRGFPTPDGYIAASEDGTSPFADWFIGLDSTAAAKVTIALARIEQGNLSSAKGVGKGVLECRLDFGPGYRVYFGRDGEVLVIVLAGGTKKRQQRDIEIAQGRWADYKQRKRHAR